MQSKNIRQARATLTVVQPVIHPSATVALRTAARKGAMAAPFSSPTAPRYPLTPLSSRGGGLDIVILPAAIPNDGGGHFAGCHHMPASLPYPAPIFAHPLEFNRLKALYTHLSCFYTPYLRHCPCRAVAGAFGTPTAPCNNFSATTPFSPTFFAALPPNGYQTTSPVRVRYQ